MESYKHSCPYCGQHIEYTVGYCGKQMTCPICGNTVTFPAIPPKTTAKGLRLDRPAEKVAPKWGWKPRRIFLFLRDFPHWKIIGGALVPFLVIGGLLVGAKYVKSNFTDQPTAAPVEAIAPVDPDSWQRSADADRIGAKVAEQVSRTLAARAAMKQAAAVRDATRIRSGGASSYTASAEEAFQRAQNIYNLNYNKFRELNAEYQKLGGKVDYQAQLSN
jgi:hypothetical protein